jgi:hypothetical protein
MPAQIYEPRVGRNYRVETDNGTFIARCVAWDRDNLLLVADPALNEGVELPIEEFSVKRTEVKLSEWR